jgi:hypothetical protein
MTTPVLDTGTPGDPPPPPPPDAPGSDQGPPDSPGGDPGGAQPQHHHRQPKRAAARQNIVAWKPEDRPAAYKPATQAHPTHELARLAAQHGGVVAVPIGRDQSSLPSSKVLRRPSKVHEAGLSVTTSVGKSKEHTFLDEETGYGRVRVRGRVEASITRPGRKARVEVSLSPHNVSIRSRNLIVSGSGLVASARDVSRRVLTRLISQSSFRHPVVRRIALPDRTREHFSLRGGASGDINLRRAKLTISLIAGRRPNEVEVKEELTVSEPFRIKGKRPIDVRETVATTTTFDYRPAIRSSPAIRVRRWEVAAAVTAVVVAAATGVVVKQFVTGSGGEEESLP